MKNCEHKNEKSTIVCSSLSSTVQRIDCEDCGQIVGYITDEVVPGIWKDDPEKRTPPPKTVPTPARYFQPAPESKKGHQK